MSDHSRRASGITMLDGAALVSGAAVASVHFRELTHEMTGLTTLGWLFLCATFTWLAVTSAGPFVFIVHRISSRPSGSPSIDDRLWMGFGLPWLLAAFYRSTIGNAFDPTDQVYGRCLFAGLLLASGPAFWLLLRTWRQNMVVRDPPDRVEAWTDLIGRTVSVTWPLQFGLGFVVTR